MSSDTAANVQVIVVRLKSLGAKPARSKAENEEVKVLLRNLKEMGFTNQEIEDLVGGQWKATTIKQYNQGIKSKGSAAKGEISRLFNEMIERGLDFIEVKRVLELMHQLDSEGYISEDVIDFVDYIKAANLNIDEVVEGHKVLRRERISYDTLKELLAFKKTLDDAKIDLGLVAEIDRTLRTYHNPQEVLQTVRQYSATDAIKKAMEDKEKELGVVAEQVKEQTKIRDELRSNNEAMQKEMDAYRHAKELGFDEASLERMSTLASRDGWNANKVVQGVENYLTAEELEAKVHQNSARKQEVEKELGILEQKAAHRKKSVDLCSKLMDEHHFSEPVIEELYGIAKKYGTADEVLHTFGLFGGALAIQEYKTALESEISALRKERDNVKGEMAAERQKMTTFMNALWMDLEDLHEKSMQDMTQEAKRQIQGVSKIMEEYSVATAKASTLQEELKLAVILNVMQRYPTEAAAKYSIEEGLNILRIVRGFFAAQKVNPVVNLSGIPIQSRAVTVVSRGQSVIELIDAIEKTMRSDTIPRNGGARLS